jgi:hypothetical protein
MATPTCSSTPAIVALAMFTRPKRDLRRVGGGSRRGYRR